jgi:hypothetical protein
LIPKAILQKYKEAVKAVDGREKRRYDNCGRKCEITGKRPDGGESSMNRSHYDGEMIQCPKCQREFPSFYTDCPYCEAATKSKIINKRGKVETFGVRVSALILALVLVAGGVYLGASMLSQGVGSFGREYAVTLQEPEIMQVGVTKQEISIAGEASTTPEEEEDTTTPEDGQEQDGQEPEDGAAETGDEASEEGQSAEDEEPTA